jgi:hypothetical protein
MVVSRENGIKHIIHLASKMQTFFAVKLLILIVNSVF